MIFKNKTRPSTFFIMVAMLFLWLCWGYNFLVIKLALPYIEPFEFAFIRSILSFFVMAGAMMLFNKLRLPRKNLGLIITLGFLQTGGFTGFTCLALVSGGTGKTAILAFTNPIWVVVKSSVLYSEKVNSINKLSLVLATVGTLFLLRFWDNNSPVESYIYAILAGFSLAGSSLIIKALHKREDNDVFHITVWQLMFGSVPLFFGMLLTDRSITEWNAVVYFGLTYNVLSTVVGWSLWSYILRYVPAGTANLNTLVIPIVGIVAGYYHLKEDVLGFDLFGISFVLSAIAISWVGLTRKKGI